jgi:hypothetical protein
MTSRKSLQPLASRRSRQTAQKLLKYRGHRYRRVKFVGATIAFFHNLIAARQVSVVLQESCKWAGHPPAGTQLFVRILGCGGNFNTIVNAGKELRSPKLRFKFYRTSLNLQRD